MRVGVTVTAAIAAVLLMTAASPAQVPPPQIPPPASGASSGPGFVSPYEITRTVRAAGFRPLAPPLREGATYVFRAVDFRHTLMRVVVDARSGAIRDATPIVSGPGPYGEAEMVEPPYGGGPPPYYGRAPYGAPPDYDGRPPYGYVRGDPYTSDHFLSEPSSAPMRPATPGTVTIYPPLPRPRPAELASQRPADEKRPDEAPAAKTDAKPLSPPAEVPPAPKTDTASAPPSPPPAKLAKPPPGPPIND